MELPPYRPRRSGQFDCWQATPGEGMCQWRATLVSRQHTNVRAQRREGSWLSALKGMSSLGQTQGSPPWGKVTFPSNDWRVLNPEPCKAPSTFSRWSRGGRRGFWKIHYYFSNLILSVPRKHLWPSLYTRITTQRCRQDVLILLGRGTASMQSL